MTTSITAFHNTQVWLNLTENWIYRQIKFLPPSIIPHVICEKVINEGQFPVPHLHVLAQNKWAYFWERVWRKLGLRYYSPYMIWQLKQHKAHILHSHFGDRAWLNLSAAKTSGVKHVVTFYGYDVTLPAKEPIWQERYATLFKEVDLILCEGSYMREALIKQGCPADKVKVQHLAVESDQIAYQPRTWQPGEPLKVLLAASFTEKKGLPYALEALGRLKNEINLQITVIGDARPTHQAMQAEKQKILQTIAHYQLEPYIRLLGYQPYDVLFQEAYNHHLFISPSVTAQNGDTEGGAPVSLLDMSATGMPIISSFHCDIPEIVLHEKTGLLAPERDVETLVKHIRWFAQNPHTWEKIGQTGRYHVETEYHTLTQGQKLAQHYLSLVPQK